ncbi:mechanosensitive ion channel family protein [Actimicrobium antarcticum]|uniref:Mechanosensitive ion channel n=1 Tax=Actimicrobium antarcticum TaxID=1051899 RepID=A0ABP7TFJ6_9BURK
MKNNILSGLLLDLWSDLQEPEVLWQIATIAGCLVLGWLLARLVRSFFGGRSPDQGIFRIGLESFSRVLSPSITLGLILVAKPLLEQVQHVHLLRLAIPLVASFVLVRLSFYVLRRVFSRGGNASASVVAIEKMIAAIVWIGFALYITGLWPDLVDLLEKTVLPLGRYKVSLLTILQAVVSVMGTLIVALWAGAALEQRLMSLDSVHSSIRAVMARMARAVLILVAILVSLSLVGIDLTVLSIFGGALGVGLGLGLQKIVGSYVSGFVILLERSMAIGDMVTVDKYYGQVTRINTRYTVLRGLDGVESIIPNELFVSGPMQNYSLSDRSIRLSTKLTVAYDTDIEALLPMLEEAAGSISRVSSAPPPSAVLRFFAADGLELEVGFMIIDPENGTFGVTSDVNRAIWRMLQSNGISIPYTQHEVRILNQVALAGLADEPVPGKVVTPPGVGATSESGYNPARNNEKPDTDSA